MIPREGAFFTPGSKFYKSGRIWPSKEFYGFLAVLVAVLQMLVFPVKTLAIAPKYGLKLAEINTVTEPENTDVPETYRVWITAYTSSPEETDDTPFETASGSTTRDGIVAANFLQFGTKIKIPSEFGDKIFTVEDRMHRRKKNFIDVWMPTKKDAFRFGIRYAEIVVVDEDQKPQLALQDK